MPPQTEAESQKMLSWLSQQGSGRNADNRNRRSWWKFGRRNQDNAERPQNQADADNDRQQNDRQNDDRQNNDDDRDQRGGNIIIGIQHIPAARGVNMPPDPKPYWVINEPYRSRELNLLHRIGVRHMLAGHWHVGTIFERDGIAVARSAQHQQASAMEHSARLRHAHH